MQPPCVKRGATSTTSFKVDDSYLTLGFRGPTWSPDAESETLCAPPGSLAPVRRAERTAGGRRTERAHRGLMDRAWRAGKHFTKPDRIRAAEINNNKNTFKVTGGSRVSADEVKLWLPASASSGFSCIPLQPQHSARTESSSIGASW